jgi:photosystem II stability/assembly factor-like uncharacterized protein
MADSLLSRGVNSMLTSDQIVVLTSTRAGLFLYAADTCRSEWKQSGPFLADFDIHHAIFDCRNGSIWAAANGPENQVFRSSDLGETWEAKGAPFDCDSIWHVEPGHSSEPEAVYAGLKPAALWKSVNGGESWAPVSSLNDHETRGEWWEGGGGLCLHTIILPEDCPGRIFVGISVAGLFRSDDSGASWRPVNSGVADFVDIVKSEGMKVDHDSVHRCVHKVVLDPRESDTMYQQNHLGVYRSRDGGESWQRIEEGLPSNFGFPIAIGGINGGSPTIFIIPEDGETLRTKEGLAVWRSEDEGQSWKESTDGLPKGYFNVNREGMAADQLSPTGVYFGDTTGVLFGSNDGGVSWSAIADGLPPIRSVEVAHLGRDMP